MHIIGCLTAPHQAVLLDGNDVADMTDEPRRIRNKHVGFVFQQFNLLPRETLQANVEIPLYAGIRSASGAAWPQRPCAVWALPTGPITGRARSQAARSSGPP